MHRAPSLLRRQLLRSSNFSRAKSASVAPGYYPRIWDNNTRRDQQPSHTRPLPEGVSSYSELDPAALAKDIHSYGTAREVWQEIYTQADAQRVEQSWRTDDLQEFGVDSFLRRHVLEHASLACGLAAIVGGKLGAASLGGDVDCAPHHMRLKRLSLPPSRSRRGHNSQGLRSALCWI